MEEPQQPEQVSKYNSGMAQIKRLDELWTKIHRYAESGQLLKWNWGLDRVWCELIGDLPEEQEDEVEEEVETKDKSPSDIERFDSINITIGDLNKKFVERIVKFPEYQTQFYTILMNKEAFLRRLQNKLGKGTKLVDADEDMIE